MRGESDGGYCRIQAPSLFIDRHRRVKRDVPHIPVWTWKGKMPNGGAKDVYLQLCHVAQPPEVLVGGMPSPEGGFCVASWPLISTFTEMLTRSRCLKMERVEVAVKAWKQQSVHARVISITRLGAPPTSRKRDATGHSSPAAKQDALAPQLYLLQ